ncbi:MAG: precorrin-8X methylmutase [Christensenellales bacterium]|jgi:precorrin-8X/cobalt-precorrin-8 methylmutase|nr:precorrin-8X methylmutase [Clostridiales bacterium]
MLHMIENIPPQEIEKRSFDIITSELDCPLDPVLAPIIKRVIHTTADFDYVDSLYFSPEVVPHALDTLRQGITLITDTTMAMAGINKRALNELHCQVECLIADEEVAKAAKLNGTTRSREAMIKASKLPGKLGFVIGNAPTALVALNEMMSANTLNPAFIIGVPVGFVNVVQSKELIRQSSAPCILSMGRKGGSNVAAAIVNALLYMIVDRK